jgi:hypothetical protein
MGPAIVGLSTSALFVAVQPVPAIRIGRRIDNNQGFFMIPSMAPSLKSAFLVEPEQQAGCPDISARAAPSFSVKETPSTTTTTTVEGWGVPDRGQVGACRTKNC